MGRETESRPTARGRVKTFVKPVAATSMALLLGLTACSKSPEARSGDKANPTDAVAAGLVAEGTPQKGGAIVVGVTAETDGWNPATAQWADAGNIVGSTIYEPLMQYNADSELVPWLAESVTPDNDAHDGWTIRLRQGIKFHDGTEMNANAVAEGLTVAMKDGLASVAVAHLLDHIEVIDDYTLDVKLTARWAQFPHMLTGQLGYIWSPTMLDKPDKGAADPVGTGPYVFDDWVPDKSFKVRAFDGYWGGPCALPDPGEAVTKLCDQAGIPMGQRNGPWLEGMEFRPTVDAQQRANALEAGDVNLIVTTSPADVAALRSDHQVVTDYDSEKTTVVLNTSKPPLDNVHVRRALAHATDRQALVNIIGAGEPLVLDSSAMSESTPWGLPADQSGYPEFDPAKARQELETYKAETGQTTVQLVLSGVAATEELVLDQQLVEMWRQVGIEARINTIEQTSFVTNLVAGDFQAAVMRNWAYLDPDSNYVFWSRETAEASIKINFTQYWSDLTQRAVTWGRTATAFDARKPGYDQLMRDRNENVADLWLYDTPYAMIADSDIRGLNPLRSLAWGNFLAKPWIGGLWIDQEADSAS